MKALLAALLFLGFAASLPAQSQSPNIDRKTREMIQSSLKDFDEKKYDDALAKLTEANKKYPEDPFIMNLLGAAYVKKKDYDTALKYFQATLAKQPDFFPALFNVGEVDFLRRSYATALDHFKKMLEKNPGNELLQFKIVLCELELGNTEAAVKALNAMKYPGDTPAWYYAQAAVEYKKGNRDKAREYVSGARYIFGPRTLLFEETFEDLGIAKR